MNRWAFYTDSQFQRTDWLIGNTKIYSDGQNNRLNEITRLMYLDCALNPDHRSVNSFRMHHECGDVWVADTVVGSGGWTMHITGGEPYGVRDITIDRVTKYDTQNTFSNSMDLSGTNVISDSIVRSSHPTDTINYLQLTDGGGNTRIVWNGSDQPDVSAIGAQR